MKAITARVEIQLDGIEGEQAPDILSRMMERLKNTGLEPIALLSYDEKEAQVWEMSFNTRIRVRAIRQQDAVNTAERAFEWLTMDEDAAMDSLRRSDDWQVDNKGKVLSVQFQTGLADISEPIVVDKEWEVE